ncbi:ROK family protein [Halorientalis litorea]|jgi:glucokinase|uniref:ROK family protein n=1 Tax=Halorientalis litorea TaxID=2931977 RepID=UPI001FF585A4|nr:ROK family protein [Halorientalis litorea]
MYAGVDLGATNVRAVVGDETATVLGRDRRATPSASGIAVTEAVLDALRAAADHAGTTPERLHAVGVGSIGPLDLAAGVVDDPANLPAVERIPLTGPIENLVDGPVYLHNDTTAAVIGERFHADRNPDDMAYLTVSSGVGAGVCVDGHILSGWDGNAGEIGHTTVDPSGAMPCGCGGSGHWEAYCAGTNIPAYAGHLHETAAVETDLPLDAPDFAAADVFAAGDDDPLAALVLERVGRWNAIGVANLVHAYAPLVVSVGGGVALNNPDRVLDPIREQLPELVISNVPEVRLTSLGDDVGVKGALASAVTGGTGDRTRVRG